jgi:E3 ubiquitin-protein ligase RNF19A
MQILKCKFLIFRCERPGCGSAFCYHCKAEWHANQTCDAARAQRQQQTFRSSSATLSLESAAAAVAGGSTASGTAAGGQHSEVKACPRCQVLAVKMHDGSCNHMTCAVCGVEFCWLCMKEISDLHYLSPSGCTFWGKKPWSRKKKLLWQLGTLVGAPVGIALLAGISIPAMLIGIPSWVGRKIHDHYKGANRHKRNLAVVGGVVSSIILSPFLAGLAVSIGVPILLCYVYGVVPIALCRSEGCGVSTSGTGVKIDIDEDPPYRPSGGISEIVVGGGSLANPSIGEASLGASMSMGSGCILENNADNASREPDRESASITAVAGASLTGSVASSYLGPPGSIYSAMRARHNRLEVGVDVHPRKKFSFSSERLSETVSLSERSATASLADYGGGVSEAASTRALAGSLLAYGVSHY